MPVRDNELLRRWMESAPHEGSTIPLADKSVPLPASYSQRGMWMAQQIAADDAAPYVVRHAYRLSGALDVEALSEALQDLLVRHEPLRTAFRLDDGELLQIICAPYSARVSPEPVPGHDEPARLKHVHEAIVATARAPFDLGSGQLLRTRLFRLAADDHILLMVVHHIANDAWSMTVLHDELLDLYTAHRSGRRPALDSLPTQYADFAQWQLANTTTEADAAYWREALAGAPPVLRLPLDRPRPTEQPFRGDGLTFSVPRRVAERVEHTARTASTTRYTVMTAVFQLVLARWTGQNDLIVGTSVSVRPFPETERMIGPFTNLLPLRGSVDSANTFRQHLTSTREIMLAALRHESFPFERMLSELRIPRKPAYSPLIQVSINSHEGLMAPLRLDGLVVEYFLPADADVQRDLSLWTPGPDGTGGVITYAVDLFERSTIERLVEDFRTALSWVTEHLDAHLSSLSLKGPPVGTVHGELPQPATPAPSEPGSAAHAALMPLIIEAWRDVLGTPQMAAEADFFRLGGESIAAMRLCNRLGRDLGIRIPVRRLYAHPQLGDFTGEVYKLVSEHVVTQSRMGDHMPVPHARTMTASQSPTVSLGGNDESEARCRFCDESVATDLAGNVVRWPAQDAHSCPVTHTVREVVERQAAHRPSDTAVLGPQQVTYGVLDERANRLARRLLDAGVVRGAAVGLHLTHSDMLIVALLAAWKAGAVAVPLQPGLPELRLRDMVRDAEVKTVLTDVPTVSTLAFPRAQVLDAEKAEREARELRSDDLGIPIRLEDPAYILYTSGSSGTPKGVVVPHIGLCNRLLWQARVLALGRDDVVLCQTSISFDVFVEEALLPLVCGARMVVAPQEAHRDVALLLDLIEEHGVTWVHFVPSLLDVFLDQNDLRQRLASLKHLGCGGESLSSALYERFRAVSDATVYHGYGPTEASVAVTCQILPSSARHPFITIGRPISNASLHVLDPQGRPVPVGETGELCIGGIALAHGYARDPGLTARRFVPDPFTHVNGGRMYRTGDLAYWTADGELKFQGRNDNQVKIHGRRLELEEIEHTLVRHPGVDRCVVLPMRDERAGRTSLTAVCVTSRLPPPQTSELIRWLGQRLSDYQVPARFTFVSEFPLLPSGKADRKRLTGRVAADLSLFQGTGINQQTYGPEGEREVMADPDAAQFQVLVNDEEQYGLLPAEVAVPAGWRSVGVTGEEGHCAAWVDEHWTDMRPLSLRTPPHEAQ
ncbi:amino acid adenylation domain-containing protein [Streptomyces lavenduligriseus]|nr:amino acid adenylation domain-containing protein [Streptomyces lavenduligriseus]